MAEEPSYIDYEAFLSPTFSPHSFANSLVLSTNNPSDTPLDLSTPLSRVLFDLQEIDTHVHNLTTKSAVPLLTHTQNASDASRRILDEVNAQVTSLTEAYKRLEREVGDRYEAAEEVRMVTERLWKTVKIGRAVARCLQLGRQLEVQVAEVSPGGSAREGSGRREDHRAMVRASNTFLALRELFSASGPGDEGEGLDRINVISTLRNDLINPAERSLISKSQQIVREFSMSSLGAPPSSSSNSTQQQQQTSSGTSTPTSTAVPSTYIQTEDTKARTTSALLALYLLSPTPGPGPSDSTFVPATLVTTLQSYIQTSLTSSLASLSRALATLPNLDRTLIEVSARCQNVVALASLLENTKPPPHPLLSSSAIPSSPGKTAPGAPPPNLLIPLLASLDTSSLPSHFWRSLASSLSGRVSDIMARGGVSARTLRSSKERVRDGLKDCVVRGSQLPVRAGGSGGKPGLKLSTATAGGGAAERNWEREVAVMTGAVIGAIGR
ncbi:MAG: hypothetical protein M4579_005064 [Chaenotheca gracillima]|nr:MAG: hypothetical protein M4579_005064 [Chaenotheca gracillima]